ncbi:M16 family metallopeptidase [Catellatospora sichuanensis]|uniref:M16 family metallopeptidase n=1 Tax=Catellatospora sichuanensis TaxID=1969805 RepID=UPI0011841755|nr:pitrilysin family protein [Catellatospora sichuanensis]
MIPRTDYHIERFTLANGLRVVLNRDASVPLVGVAVVYDVGVRSEPPGRTGFAHLFEHLMFQGSANLEKLAHFRYVQGAGGTFNGSTHLDYTDYFQTVPSNALERMMFLEADRMGAPLLTEENLRNQIDVVKEEIRVNVLNRPYGGFPWLKLPPVLFDTFPNAHDGYGSFADLEAATVEDATEFFQRFYASGNAVLSIAGDFDTDEAQTLVEKHFGAIPARPAAARSLFAEPDPTNANHTDYVDQLAPAPAVAAAWRVPDPIGQFGQYLACVVLAEVLTDGEASRLVRRLVRKERMVSSVGGYLGFMGDPFDVRHPTALVLQAYLNPDESAEEVLNVIDEELTRLAMDGLTNSELTRISNRIATNLLRSTDAVISRAVRMGVLELQRANPGLINDLPQLIGAVTVEDVQSAAALFPPHSRASIAVRPQISR